MTAPVVGELRTVVPGLLVDPPMLLITRLIDDYVLAVPVTAPDALTGPPALLIDGPDGPLAVWPRAETGLDTRILGHHLAMLLDADEVTAMRRWAEDGAPPPFTPAFGDYDEVGVSHLLRTMQALCYYQPARNLETR